MSKGRQRTRHIPNRYAYKHKVPRHTVYVSDDEVCVGGGVLTVEDFLRAFGYTDKEIRQKLTRLAVNGREKI